MLLVFSLICALLSPTFALPAAAATVVVQPGESIQAAIDAAPSGTIIVVQPGTYQENLLIAKDGISLRGSGAGRTILEPPATPNPFCGVGDPNSPPGGGVIGICITDANFATGGEPTINHTVMDVSISGFTVRNFSADGIVFFGTKDISTRQVEAANNAGYGIAAFVSSHERHTGNWTYGNHEAGIYVGDSPEAEAFVSGNTSYDNVGSGIFLRDASNGHVFGNNVYGNCIGIWILNTGGGSGATNWMLTGNTANANDMVCADEEEGPPLSGLGIFIAGGSDNVVIANTTDDNVPQGDTLASGGIVLFSTADFGGDTADNNRIIANRAHGNEPVDLFWDQMGKGNIFLANRCATSDPAGLCR
jgi:parallel beta-helix repeat protein